MFRIRGSINQARYLSAVGTNNFVTIYKFPYIRVAALINRLKLYQTAITGMYLPSAVFLNHINLITSNDLLYTCMFGFAGIIPLYGLGAFSTKLVGFVYLNETKKLVKFSYVDFWGSRRDIVKPLNEVVLFSESKPSVTDTFYSKVKIDEENKNALKICTRYGIVDAISFNKIFVG